MSPLRYTSFRNIWFGTVLLSLGFLIETVAAAWAMTELTSSASMVALVQTATMLPVLLIALPAGAFADMYDTRSIAMLAICIALVGATGLFVLSLAGQVSAPVLLSLCAITGIGMALFTPVWQVSVVDQVPREALPPAVALNSVSYNIARSVGPAIGGVVVATAGAVAAFAISAVLYVPLLAILAAGKRTLPAVVLPPERLSRALMSGLRYVAHSPITRTILIRALLFGMMAGSVTGLLPLVARDLLKANADTFGILLGGYGGGAIVGALSVSSLRRRCGPEGVLRISGVALFCGICTIAISRFELLTLAALVGCGAAWMLSSNTFNIGVQLPAPRWVAGRALATFQACLWGGSAMGSWIWGLATDASSVDTALVTSAIGLLASVGIGLKWPLQTADDASLPAILRPDPPTRIEVSGRSGPIVVEVEYAVRADAAAEFYAFMQSVRMMRQRSGAYGWSLACDMADPELWVERYHCPTWHDYLRQRNRTTEAERALHQQTQQFLVAADGVRVRRLLERPFNAR